MHIALVEPGKIGRTMMTRLLEARGDVVTAFADGLEAYRHLCSGAPVDALLTSIEVPGIGGLELCWHARVLDTGGKHLHIIVMSSNHEISNAIEALDSGADDFVHKPPITAELNARLRAAERLVAAQDKLLTLATRDPMTSLLNRRAFFRQAEKIVGDTGSGKPPASAIMLDIDHFKSVNDRYGHQAGDLVICAVAELLKMDGGIEARLGGEEFVVLLPATAAPKAMDYAKRLRAAVAAVRIETNGILIGMTCSFGVAETLPDGTDSVDNLLIRADGALYRSKHDGRDRVTLASPDDPAGSYSNVIRRPPGRVTPAART